MPKSIELNDHAYARLKMARQKDESWSDVIERCVKPKQSVEQILKAIRESAPPLEVLDELDKTITRRRRQPRARKV